MAREPDVQTMQMRELEELTNSLEELRRKYDLYFLGMEKREPGLDRERFERALLKSKLIRSPVMLVRYKYQGFLAKVRTYQALWDRVNREIEEGTYRRATTQAERQAGLLAESAVRRAQGVEPSRQLADDAPIEQRRMHNTAKSAEAFLAVALGRTHAELPSLGAEPPNGSPTGSPSRPSERSLPVPARTIEVPAVDPVVRLFEEYVGAKKARGDDTSRLTLQTFAKSVEKQIEQARGQLGADVELKVRVTPEKVSVVALKKKA